MPISFLGLILWVIWFPTYMFGESVSYSQKVLFLSLVVLCLVYLIPLLLNRTINLPKGLAFLCLTMVTIMSMHFLITENSSSVIEFLNVFRYPTYLLILSVGTLGGGSDAEINKKYELPLTTAFNIIIFLELSFLVFQYNYPRHPFVMAFSRSHISSFLGIRLSGSFDWSYAFTFFLQFYCIYYFFIYIYKRSIFAFLLFIATSIAIFTAQSRTGIGSYFLIMSYIMFFASKSKTKLIPKVIIVMMMVLIAIAVVSSDDFTYIKNKMVSEHGKLNITRYLARQAQLRHILKSDGIELLFGNSKAEDLTIENAYGDYLYRYGVGGLICYLAFVAILIMSARWIVTIAYNQENENLKALGMAIYGMTISVPLYSFACSPLDGHKISILYYLMFGFAYGKIYCAQRATSMIHYDFKNTSDTSKEVF